MHVPANVPSLFISDSIQVLASKFFVYQFARSFTQVLHCFLLTELFNICRFKQASLSASWLCITFPRQKSLVSHFTLGSIYIFVSTTPSFHFVSKSFWKRNLGKL